MTTAKIFVVLAVIWMALSLPCRFTTTGTIDQPIPATAETPAGMPSLYNADGTGFLCQLSWDGSHVYCLIDGTGPIPNFHPRPLREGESARWDGLAEPNGQWVYY